MPKENKPVDWGGIETAFCAGQMSVREIARWHGVSHTAINKRAKRDGWVRKAQPRHIERELVSRPVPPATLADPSTARVLVGQLLDELDTVTAHHGELEEMISAEESDPRRRNALLKALSLGERAMTLKNISQTLKTLNEAGEANVE